MENLSLSISNKKNHNYLKRVIFIFILSLIWTLLLKIILNIKYLEMDIWINSFVSFLGSCIGVFGGFISSKLIDSSNDSRNKKQIMVLMSYLLHDEVKSNRSIFTCSYFQHKSTEEHLDVKELMKFENYEWSSIKREVVKYKGLSSDANIVNLFSLYAAFDEINMAFNTGKKIECSRKKKLLDRISTKLYEAEKFIEKIKSEDGQ